MENDSITHPGPPKPETRTNEKGDRSVPNAIRQTESAPAVLHLPATNQNMCLEDVHTTRCPSLSPCIGKTGFVRRHFL